MIIRSMLFAAALVAGPAAAAPSSGDYADAIQSAPYIGVPALEIMSIISLQHDAQLQMLHDEGLALQQADGGTLTPAHRAELQARLDKLQASYRRRIENYDPWAVDSFGMRKY